MCIKKNFNFKPRNLNFLFLKNLSGRSLIEKIKNFKSKKSFFNEIANFISTEIKKNKNKKLLKDFKLPFKSIPGNIIYYYLNQIKISFFNFDFENFPKFFYYPLLFNIILSSISIFFIPELKRFVFFRNIITFYFLDNRYILFLEKKLKILEKNIKNLNLENIKIFFWFLVKLQKKKVSNLVFENLSIKNPLISFLKKNKEMEYKKKNFKKIVYQQVFVKKFFEELSRGLTNYSYKKPVKKLNKDEKEHLKLISYKKLKLLNKLEIFTKLIFLKKEYLN
jgi:hypothetical protein